MVEGTEEECPEGTGTGAGRLKPKPEGFENETSDRALLPKQP